MKYFYSAIYYAERRELDYAVFFAKLSSHSKAEELINMCREQYDICRNLKIKACEYGVKKWYKHAAKQFAAALKINAQDKTAYLGLIDTAGKGFIF
jgi:hypothetical protein